MNNRYGTLAAWFYELDKPVGRSFGDVEFYRERLSECTGPILEPAVGNGRVLVPLIEAGCDVEGFDASPEMLALCRRACERRRLAPRLTLQTFEAFDVGSGFAAIIIPAGSFQLIADPKGACRVLRRFRESLAPGGRLILDLDPIGALASPAAPLRQCRDGDDLLTLRERRLTTDLIRQACVSELRYEHWRSGRLLAREIELFTLRFWGVPEFELALRRAGFFEIAISGNYRHGELPNEDARIVSFEARAGIA